MQITRKNAFLIHLSISLLIFATLIAVMWWWWFPGALFSIDGGWNGLRIIALVDVVLGPTLTLMFVRAGKKYVWFDIGAIAAVQLAALIWGVWTIQAGQTGAIVQLENEFITVAKSSLQEAQQKIRVADLQPRDPAELSDHRPPIVVVEMNLKNSLQFITDIFIKSLPDQSLRTDYYESLSAKTEYLREVAEKVNLQLKPQDAEHYEKALKKLGKTAEEVLSLRLKARYGGGLVILDAADLKLIQILALPDGGFEFPQSEQTQVED